MESGSVYGYRKVTTDLRELGETCSRHRVARLMNSKGLVHQSVWRLQAMISWMSGRGHTRSTTRGLLVAVLMMLCMSGCHWVGGPVVTVKNVGASPLHQVQVEVGGAIVDVGQLGVGESVKLRPEIKADSAVRILYVDGGRAVSCDGDVYFTGNIYVVAEAEIGGGVCRVADVTD